MSVSTQTPHPLALPARVLPLGKEAHTRRVDALTRLLDSPGWAYMAERLRRRQAEIVQEVMSPSTPPDKVPELRRLHAEIEAILAMPTSDREVSQRAIDAAAGPGSR